MKDMPKNYWYTMSLGRDLRGYNIGPHTDTADKWVTTLFYLPKCVPAEWVSVCALIMGIPYSMLFRIDEELPHKREIARIISYLSFRIGVFASTFRIIRISGEAASDGKFARRWRILIGRGIANSLPLYRTDHDSRSVLAIRKEILICTHQDLHTQTYHSLNMAGRDLPGA